MTLDRQVEGRIVVQELDDLVPVFARTGHHQRSPARAIGGVNVEGLELYEMGNDREMVVGYGPVEWKAVVFVAAGG